MTNKNFLSSQNRKKQRKDPTPNKNKSFYCETCDRGYQAYEKYREHCDQHIEVSTWPTIHWSLHTYNGLFTQNLSRTGTGGNIVLKVSHWQWEWDQEKANWDYYTMYHQGGQERDKDSLVNHWSQSCPLSLSNVSVNKPFLPFPVPVSVP